MELNSHGPSNLICPWLRGLNEVTLPSLRTERSLKSLHLQAMVSHWSKVILISHILVIRSIRIYCLRKEPITIKTLPFPGTMDPYAVPASYLEMAWGFLFSLSNHNCSVLPTLVIHQILPLIKGLNEVTLRTEKSLKQLHLKSWSHTKDYVPSNSLFINYPLTFLEDKPRRLISIWW